jgi:putative flippase GtrA
MTLPTINNKDVRLSRSGVVLLGLLRNEALFQFVKYGISGGLATMVHIFFFHLAAWKLFPSLQENDFVIAALGVSVAQVDVATRTINSMLSNIVAFVFSNLTAYIINIHWVFESGRHKKIVEIGLFYLVSGMSIAIGTGIMGFLIRYYGMQTTYAFTANLVSSAMINFAVRKYFIFKG